MSQSLAHWLCHPSDSEVHLHRFVDLTRQIDRLKNALPVAPYSPVFTIRTFFFKILNRLVDSSSNALFILSIFTVQSAQGAVESRGERGENGVAH